MKWKKLKFLTILQVEKRKQYKIFSKANTVIYTTDPFQANRNRHVQRKQGNTVLKNMKKKRERW
jgi:hypothetical protein